MTRLSVKTIGGSYLVGFFGGGLWFKNFGELSFEIAALALVPAAVIIWRKLGFSPHALLLLGCLVFGGWWGASHSGLSRSPDFMSQSQGKGQTKNKSGQQAHVIRRQPFTDGFNSWPYVLVISEEDTRQWLVKGRYRQGEQGWLSCPPPGEGLCRFRTSTARRFRPHPIKAAADRSIHRLEASIRHITPKAAAAFYQAILLARPHKLDGQTKAGFKNLGIYHLLVTSGLHFAILQQCLRAIFDTLLRAGYSAVLISPYQWFFVRRLGVFTSVLLLVGYGLGIGLPVAVKRCLFMIGISQLASLSWWPMPIAQRLLLCLIVASVVFPLGFFTVGSLLSWSCTLLLCLAASTHQGHSQGHTQTNNSRPPASGMSQQLARFMLWQGQLVLMGFLLIGSYTPIAWLANGLIATMFTPVLIIAFTAVVAHALLAGQGWEHVMGFVGTLGQQFLVVVATFDRLNPFTVTAVTERSAALQLGCDIAAVTICALALNSHAKQRDSLSEN